MMDQMIKLSRGHEEYLWKAAFLRAMDRGAHYSAETCAAFADEAVREYRARREPRDR